MMRNRVLKPNTEYRAVQLAEGRVLGVLESGAADGKPIFFFPGFGVSATAVHPDSTLAESAGVRIISVDRPGIGKSSPSSRRTLLDWPSDIAALADRLGIQRFGVLGWSGGGPHALACAFRLAGRVSVTGLFSCAPPFADAQAVTSMPAKVECLAFVAKFAPTLLRIRFYGHCRQIRKDADALLLKSARDLSDADREIIFDARYHAFLKTSMIQACNQGPRGLIDDVLVIARPWGFGLDQLRFPVYLWHGEADKTIPVEVGRYLADAIDNCRASFIPGGGHFSYLTHWNEMFQTLAASM
jgi:pimeloyl-ACP methyl ester carboxylesterase